MDGGALLSGEVPGAIRIPSQDAIHAINIAAAVTDWHLDGTKL